MTVLAAPTALESAVQRVTAQLESGHVPALELAVVRDGEPLFAGALGVRGVEDPVPAGAATLFHHGSCGKAYTGLLAALLAEEKLLDLDAPVRRYVPELRLPDPVIADRVTVRDLVSHRSGLDRHDLAWIFNPSWSPEECIRRLEHLPLVGDIRAQLHYSNLGFTLAGLAIGRATGGTWADELRRRVLEPLGMTRTLTCVTAAQADPDHARPHLLRDDQPVRTLWRVLDGVAPAGQLLSCAQDSVRWLGLHLGDHPALGAAATASKQPQMLVPAGMSPFPEMDFFGYAMGWMVGSYRGRKLVWHNGGIDGFSTQTLLLPEQRIGIIASANLHGSSLPLAVVLDLADALLGIEPGDRSWFDRIDAEAVKAAAVKAEAEQAESERAGVPAQPAAADPVPGPAHPLTGYVGRYRHLGYGDLVVTSVGDGLSARMGEFDVDLRHRHYDTWRLRYDPLEVDGSLTFMTAADGSVAEVVAELEPGSQVRFERVQQGTP